MQILIVDDHPNNLNMIEATLDMMGGYVVHRALNANDGLEILRQQRIQLVICDWMMPEMSGVDMVRAMRREFVAYYVYVIMVTAKTETSDILSAFEAGVDDFISRPFNLSELRVRVKAGRRMIDTQNQLSLAVEALNTSNEEWKATANGIPQLVCLLDRDANILRVNNTVEMWGLAWEAEAISSNLFDTVANVYEGLADELKQQWNLICHRAARYLDYKFVAFDEKLGHHFEVQCEPIEKDGVADDLPSFVALTIHDITERHNLERALQDTHQQLQDEHERTNDLLLNILPESVAARLKQGEKIIADEIDDATVLFADIVGFTEFASDLNAVELVRQLNIVFEEFDDICEDYKLEKIKTMGDGYMAACGVPHPVDDHARYVMDAATAMIRTVQIFSITHDINLKVRIGVHSGRLVAGVIGTRKFAYDVWGATVNIASRLESSGQANAIHLSADTVAHLPPDYDVGVSQTVQLKGVGEMQSYLLDLS